MRSCRKAKLYKCRLQFTQLCGHFKGITLSFDENRECFDVKCETFQVLIASVDDSIIIDYRRVLKFRVSLRAAREYRGMDRGAHRIPFLRDNQQDRWVTFDVKFDDRPVGFISSSEVEQEIWATWNSSRLLRDISGMRVVPQIVIFKLLLIVNLFYLIFEWTMSIKKTSLQISLNFFQAENIYWKFL